VTTTFLDDACHVRRHRRRSFWTTDISALQVPLEADTGVPQYFRWRISQHIKSIGIVQWSCRADSGSRTCAVTGTCHDSVTTNAWTWPEASA
jgi:hypothetical protein